MATKKTKGKQKIEMKKVEKFENRQVAFSQRRSGIYKKATELMSLCGADVGLLVFSPTDKPFSYGEPSFEEIAKRFLMQHSNNFIASISRPPVDAARKQRIDTLSRTYNDLVDELDAMKAKAKSIKKTLNTANGKEPYKGWWNTPVKELTPEEVQKTLESFKDLHDQLCKLVIEKTESAPIDLNLPPTADKENE